MANENNKKKKTDHESDHEFSCVCKRSKYDVDVAIAISHHDHLHHPLEKDRLSELPEYLIVDKILSLLPTEDAIRTGVLSTRWKNLWKHIDNVCLRMTKRSYTIADMAQFLSIVEHTVMECVSAKSVSIHTHPSTTQDCFPNFVNFDRLLQLVYSSQGRRKVESLTIQGYCISFQCRYVPPEWFYHNSTLVKLNISYWNLHTKTRPPVAVVSWTSLRSLTMTSVFFNDVEMLPKILSGCPVLENLDLNYVHFNDSLNITSPCLLKLSMVCHNVFHKISINAPRLQFLNLKGPFWNVEVHLVNAPPLVHAKLEIESQDGQCSYLPVKLLESLRHAQEITIGDQFIPALSFWKLSPTPYPLLDCKRLTLRMHVYKCELPGVIGLLQSAHNLETLAIVVQKYDMWSSSMDLDRMCNFDAKTYLSSMESGDGLRHLKNIEVTYCYCKKHRNPMINKECVLLEFVEYMLKIAHALKRFVIATKDEFCKCPTKNCAQEKSSMLSTKLSKHFMGRKQVFDWKSRKSYVEIIIG